MGKIIFAALVALGVAGCEEFASGVAAGGQSFAAHPLGPQGGSSQCFSSDACGGTVASIVTADSNADASLLTGTVNETLVYAGGQGRCQASWRYTATRVHQ